MILALMYDFHINDTPVLSVEDGKADSISRKQGEPIQVLDPQPKPVPTEFWRLLAVR